MKTRLLLGALAVVGLSAAAGVVGLLQFPAARQASAAVAPVSADEHAAALALMKPPKRSRPVIAVVGANGGTETTDYLVPYAVLKRADVGEVWALGTKPGVLKMRPALAILPDATTAAFDRQVPDGADFVIVPALEDSADPETIAWVQAQAKRGATIVGICDGGLVLANAGLLDGRRATGHWLTIGGTAAAHPTMRHVRDRRYVADTRLVTTTGVSASLPVSLALVEAIAGRERAEAVARALGVETWDATHDSKAYHLIRDDIVNIASNAITSLWNRDVIAIRVADGVDLVALSFTADAYARTFRSRVATIVPVAGHVRTDQGLRVLADPAGQVSADLVLDVPENPPARALDAALAGIAHRYGAATSDMVRLQLEYPARAQR